MPNNDTTLDGLRQKIVQSVSVMRRLDNTTPPQHRAWIVVDNGYIVDLEPLVAFIITSNHQAVEEFAAGLKEQQSLQVFHEGAGPMKAVPVKNIDAHLANYKATVNTETHSNDSGDNREQRDCPTCAGKGYVGGYKSVTNSNNCPACHGLGKVKREETP